MCVLVCIAPSVFHISALRGVQLEAAKQLRLEAFTAAQEAHHLKPPGERGERSVAYDSLDRSPLPWGKSNPQKVGVI